MTGALAGRAREDELGEHGGQAPGPDLETTASVPVPVLIERSPATTTPA